MSWLFPVLAAVLGFALGALLVWMVQAAKIAGLRTALQTGETLRVESERRTAEALRALLAQVSSVTAEKLAEREKSLSERNGAEVRALLEPLYRQLESFRTAANESAKATQKVEGEIRSHFDVLKGTAVRFEREATGFVAALKSGNKKQGLWGENVLADVLTRSGLVEGEHFVTQTGTGEGDIPDAVVFDAVSSKMLVIDAKTSLKDYLDAYNADDEGARTAALRQHLASMRKHVQELADKHYPSRGRQLRTGYTYIDLVAMFVPCDGMLEEAIRQDPKFPQFAYDRGVVLVTPLTLLGYLWLIARGWSRYNLDRSCDKIFEQAKLLVERVDKLFVNLETARRKMQSAADELDGALRLAAHDGSGRSIKGPAIRICKLGVKPDKGLKSAELTQKEEEGQE